MVLMKWLQSNGMSFGVNTINIEGDKTPSFFIGEKNAIK
jgi:hypothetical protein